MIEGRKNGSGQSFSESLEKGRWQCQKHDHIKGIEIRKGGWATPLWLNPSARVCEAWAKLAQQWLMCVPLGIHLEPINKELMLLVII